MEAGPHYWFTAKRYGWGWGPPASWKGWIVLVAFFVLLGAGFFVFPPAQMLVGFITYVAALGLLLVVVCWIKGEPPRWRWGKD